MAKLKVEDLMTTAVMTLRASDTVARLQADMVIAEIRHMPVVDDHHHVIGMVSDRDLRRAAKPGARIADIMTSNPYIVRPGTPAADAAAVMLEHKIGSLPVVGSDEQLIGIITETDFLRVAESHLRKST